MKKIFIPLSAALLLSTNLLSQTLEKSSLGIEINSAKATQDTGFFNKSDNSVAGGLFFKVEKRLENTDIFYGIGGDFLYSKFKPSGITTENKVLSLYPVVSYQIDKDISGSFFIGPTYHHIKSGFPINEKDNQIGFAYGLGLDYSHGDYTHGLIFRKGETKFEKRNQDIDFDYTLIGYRFGIKF